MKTQAELRLEVVKRVMGRGKAANRAKAGGCQGDVGRGEAAN